MPAVFKTADRIFETSTTVGVGAYALAGAQTGFQPFSVWGASNYGEYFATDDVNWEVGLGTWTGGPSTLARTKIYASSNGGAAVNWGGGTTIKIRSGKPATLGMPVVVTKSVAGGANVTLAPDEQRCDILVLTGALTADISVFVDATPWRWAAVVNNTTGDFTPTVKVNGQTGIAVNRGGSRALYCDGVDVKDAYTDRAVELNKLINPDWLIDQINEGALYTINGAAAQGPDGWSGEAIGGGGGVFKLRTLADPDNAALKCLEITCTTIDAAIAAGERYTIFAAIEGYDVTDLKAGTASAEYICVRFKLKINVNGTYGVSIANSAKNRSYVGAIVVPDANEHEYTLPIPMDQAGAWLYTNGVGLYLRLTLAGGTSFQAAPGAWNAADNYVSNAAQANFMSNVANIGYLKGISLTKGAVPPARQAPDIQRQLAKAMRYYWKSFKQGVAVAQNIGVDQTEWRFSAIAAGTNVNGFSAPFPVRMRSIPTGTTYNPAAANAQVRDLSTGVDCSSTSINQALSDDHFLINCSADAGCSIGSQLGVHFTFNARLT